MPTGTVTFLFTDLEGSTRLWEEERDAMAAACARHLELLHAAVAAHDGVVISDGGDGIAAAFASAPQAVAAAINGQRALTAETWGVSRPLRARIGLHTGDGRIVGDRYDSQPLNRCARLMAVAHGGQLVVSGATAALVGGDLPDGVDFVDLGEHRLRDLQSSVHVFQVAAPGLAAEFPALRSLDARPGNLPRQVTTFVGRESEIESISELVRESTLVTLTGVGGVGKTRLALQIAAEAVTDFPDGAWLCEFAPVTDAGAVWETLAADLRVQPTLGRNLDELVLDYLAPKRILLILDNCEHLLDAVARQVEAITQRCADASVLATSREGLALPGERIVAVPSLPSGDAEQLFADRAHAAKHEFLLSDRNAQAVGELCRRLDGIPLAIELAAARARSLSPEDLVARLDQRFKLLTRGSRAALERHQTLRSTIDWSYDLLEPLERKALDALSVFAGGCDLAAAEAVLADDDLDASDVVDVLGQLVDKSLMIADDPGAGVHYRLFESIRQYAQERLEAGGETDAVRRRHADHFTTLAERYGRQLRGRDAALCIDAVGRDVDNFRAALDWAVEAPSPDHATRLVGALAVTGAAIGYVALEWAEVASTIPGIDRDEGFAQVAAWAAWRATLSRDFSRSEVHVAAAAAALDEQPNVYVARARGTLAFFQGDANEALRQAGIWIDVARSSGDAYELAHANCLRAGAMFVRSEEEAAAAWEEAVAFARDAEIPSALSIALPTLAGFLPFEQSDRALALLEEAAANAAGLGDPLGVSQVTLTSAAIAARRGDWRPALRAAADVGEQKLQLGDLVTIWGPFHFATSALFHLGQLEPAAVLRGKLDAIDRSLLPEEAIEDLASIDAGLVDALGAEATAAVRERGAALSNSDAVAYVRAHADRVLSEETLG
jgi:predicted ATPase/class 3 adenylate cyclase